MGGEGRGGLSWREEGSGRSVVSEWGDWTMVIGVSGLPGVWCLGYGAWGALSWASSVSFSTVLLVLVLLLLGV